ncbi:hypothetical protein D3C81_577030 [compost metagenome]
MSISKDNSIKLNLFNNNEKNSKFNENNLILYIEGQEVVLNESEIIKAYEEMAKINLELAETCMDSCIQETDEYEKWLCGV